MAYECATDCTQSLPPTNFNQCAPNVNRSEIIRVFWAAEGSAPLTDWKSATEWNTRISQTKVDDIDVIRVLTVVGDKPAPTSTPIRISGDREYTPYIEHTLNLVVDDTSDENYEFMRSTQCGGRGRLWYETIGGKMYGGNSGNTRSRLNLNNILAQGEAEIERITGTATWRDRTDPDRADSPIFGVDFPRAAPAPGGG